MDEELVSVRREGGWDDDRREAARLIDGQFTEVVSAGDPTPPLLLIEGGIPWADQHELGRVSGNEPPTRTGAHDRDPPDASMRPSMNSTPDAFGMLRTCVAATPTPAG